ncbi:acyl-CoA carboxylase subunit beta [Oceanibacterium hippocampi]|uniref:Methylmalonyl-CoA carboxyltransferase 12S subunit n=1 Tax=Oceanibacterium hippocampi TaxID=745714 RepID=A0A1Y5TY06_9PROT|nr:carboxyl transferase domain-containing protein [Oceanibacterium hippocampi]SLN73033.1 Methylmalonyl-CoA carboxyltransferase 12S subunit [Oceanibacterium hippocampi]
MSWEADIEELRRREALARRMGGADKVKRQYDAGRLTVRERIDRLLDPGSFHEVGALAGRATYDPAGEIADFMPANFVFGRGLVDGRPIVVAGDDFTVRGGASDASIRGKQGAAEQMANEYRLPIVRLIEGTGGGGSVKSIEIEGYTYLPANPAWEWVVANMATVPVVSLALGPVAGLGAARAVSSHYSVMVKGLSQLFVAGPPVVAGAGETVDKEGLGGSAIHTRNGAIDDEVATEDEAIQAARRFLSYMPRSVDELPPRRPVSDDAGRRDASLIDAIPRNRRKIYRMRPILDAVFDRDSFFEIGRRWGRSIITGLARLDGWPVAVMAGEPSHYGGAWTAAASHKITRFVDMAETFHLPVVHLVDCPGFLIGTASEQAATIRHGARALSAIYQATVPWCSVVVRKAFGVAGAAHTNAARCRFRYAWPSGDWGSLPVEGGLEAAYKADLAAADDPVALRSEIEDRLNKVRSPFRSAEHFSVEEIIDPRDTRPLLCEFANLAAPLRRPGPSRFGMRP